MPHRLIVGCMTGTSIDALDTALVRVQGSGLTMSASFIRGTSRPLAALAPRLRALADQQPLTAADIATLAHDFSLAHAAAIRALLNPGERPDLICVHGQTVFHKPPISWQLFNPWPLCRATGAPVVFDFRGHDLAAGGQGAPITPIADWILFHHPEHTRAIVNLGGFCNFTLLTPSPAREVAGADACTCNLLLDAVARKLLNAPFDQDGRTAAEGSVHDDALEDLRRVLASQSRSGRSLGTGDEVLEWVSRWRAHAQPSDIAATACEALGHTIAERLQGATEIYLAGGGAKNRALTKSIESWSSAPVKPLDALGIPADFRESAEFAILGALCQDRVPITLPATTGVPAPAPIAGAWAYP